MKTSPFTAKTQEIIDTLALIDKEHPHLDKHVIESCFEEHLSLLGLKPLPVHWVADAQAGYGELAGEAG